MRTRCQNPRSPDFKHYGGRGITVYDQWSDFSIFLADMGERPEGMSLERRDSEKGYSPENCVWATAATQARNRKTIIMVEIDGRLQCVSDWCQELGINRMTVYHRIQVRGMTPVQALTTPLDLTRRRLPFVSRARA